MDLIADIRQVYDNYGFETEILAASIRTVNHVTESARIGADVITGPSGRDQETGRPPVDRQRSGNLPGGLGQNRSENPLICNTTARCRQAPRPAQLPQSDL